MKAIILDVYERSTSFLEKLSRFYNNRVYNSPKVYDYLVNSRRLTQETISRYKIGFCDNSQKVFQFIEMNHLDQELLYSTGVFLKKDDLHFDLFYERITFPIRDINGKVIAFSGRTLDDSNTCKYINNTASLVFCKSLTLFNLDVALPAILSLGYAVVVEGIVDAISLTQAGLTNVVAPCGTAFTEEHAQILRYLTNNLVLMFDNDDAGRKAYSRAEKMCKEFQLTTQLFSLPGSPGSRDFVKDPDDYVKKYGIYPMITALNALTF